MGGFIKPEEWQPVGGITLEPAAHEVATSSSSRSVIAGPGAGKTELLAQRAVYLLQTGLCRPPQRILAISFKRDAAKNLKSRVASRCSPEQARRFDSYTFDAFAKSLVDRFLPVIPEWCRPPRDYRVLFPTRQSWDEFLRGVEPPNALGGMLAARAVNLSDVERWGPLPLVPNEPAAMRDWLARQWWQTCLAEPGAGVSFAMISRLAEAILTHNPQVLKALRLTYSHVFLDEFQDTTASQYRLTTLAFAGSDALLTAVGDTKQRIMTWAGAEAEVFAWFERDFDAQRERLQMNHRSNRRIVQIINDLVRVIEPNAVETQCGREADDVPDNAAGFYVFRTDAAEAQWVADYIARDIAESRGIRQPDDFAILVRVRADRAEGQLAQAFAAQNLRLRNETRSLHGIPIQDLMSDELALLVLGLLRLAIEARGHEVYEAVQETLGSLLGVDYDNPADLKRLESTVRRAIRTIRELTNQRPSATDMSLLVVAVVGEVGVDAIRGGFRQYDNEEFFANVQLAIAALMQENAVDDPDWSQLLDHVEGKGQVRLMTIHKSKGLEYHTMIFVGLHENAFFGYRRNQEEETNAFFVALSRARERALFTQSRESGRTVNIQGLIGLLDGAAVPTIEVG